MRWLGLCLLVGGCMTDSDGDVCGSSPPWLSEGPTECPGSNAGGSSGPTYHRYSDPSAIETFGGVRIAMRSSDPAVDQIEIVTLDLATSAVSYPELLAGPSGVPQLVGDDAGAYLVWRDRDSQSFGATLDANNAVGEVFEFGKIAVQPLAVGERFLAVEYSLDLQQARWIEANGAVGAPFDFPGALSGYRGDIESGGGVVATLFRRGTTISVARTNGPEVELARDSGMGSLAVLPDGAILATYTKALTPTAYHDLHMVRIEPDGTTTDEIVNLQFGPELVVAGDRVFAVVTEGYPKKVYQTYELDSSGAIIRSRTKILKLAEGYEEVSIVPYQRDLIVFTSKATIEATHFDGAPATPVVIAELYEIDDGGCSAGGGAGFAIVLAFAGLRRRRRR